MVLVVLKWGLNEVLNTVVCCIIIIISTQEQVLAELNKYNKECSKATDHVVSGSYFVWFIFHVVVCVSGRVGG